MRSSDLRLGQADQAGLTNLQFIQTNPTRKST